MGADGVQPKVLRDYQEAAKQAIHERYAAGISRQLLSAATGSGKTEIAAFLIKDKIEDGDNCLFLAHRERLVTQAADRIKGIVGWGHVGVVNADSKDWWRKCVVATVQSAAGEKQLNRAPRFKTIIVDEAHRSNSNSYHKVIDKLLAPGGHLLGITATPNRTDKKGLIPAVFQELVFEIGMKELIEKGYLAQVIGKEIKLPIDFSKIKTQVSTEGINDYRPDEVKKAFEEANWLERITEGWQRVASERRTIIFVPPGIVDGRGCGMAHSLAEYMQARGIRAAAVDGTTKQSEQDRVIGDFTEGRIQVLVNVNIFTEGLDIPPIDCVLFARPTKSSIIYSQSIGRGGRLFPGKENCLVIDVTGITKQLADNGQGLMNLGKVLPTDEQERDEKAERIKRAKRLIKKLWLKGIVFSLVEERIVIEGPIGPRQQKEVDELSDEIRQVLEEGEIGTEAAERRPANTSLLTSDQIEIRDIDYIKGAIKYNWDIRPNDKRALITHNSVTYEILRTNREDNPYCYAEHNGNWSGSARGWPEAKEAVENHIAEQEQSKRRRFADRNAAWRQKGISQKQAEILGRMKLHIPTDCTAGMASDMIDAAIKRRGQRKVAR